MKRAAKEPEQDTAAVRKSVGEIIEKVKKEGEAAVRYYSNKFDNWNPKSFRVSDDEILAAKKNLPATEIEDIDFCQTQIRNFARQQLEHLNNLNFETETLPGIHLGQKTIPVKSSGAYIPGGRYPMLASAHMTVITPKVAGVPRVVACSPPVKGAGLWAGTLYAMAAAGADEIYCMGGVYALAALAYGMEGLEPVDMIVGAGNRYVAEAKRKLFGDVGIDLLAGPTEILIIADKTADPSMLAADLLGQAEHDPNSRVALVSLSDDIASQTIEQVEKQLVNLPTREVASISWEKNGEIIIVESREEAVEVSNAWAPEHLEVQTEDYRYYFENCHNYGALFLGEETTVAYGDKIIGTNHVLPTRRAARYTGGLSVAKFIKTVTYQYANKTASAKIAEICERACSYENMLAHGITCKMRKEKYSK